MKKSTSFTINKIFCFLFLITGLWFENEIIFISSTIGYLIIDSLKCTTSDDVLEEEIGK